MAPPHCSPDYEDNDEDDIEAAAEAEAHLRKRFLCTQLTDCAKVVEINAHKMSQFAAAGGGGWRQAHILRHNLAAIRDTVYTIEFALEELVDALARISLERNDSKATEFHQLSAPLFTSQSLIRRLRANLDGTGWSLQALARQTAAPLGTNDALDQFVAVLRQLPRDCYRLVQWIYLLGVWNNGGTGPAVFLSTSTHPHSHSVPPPPAPQPYTSPPINAQRYSTSSSSTSNESPRNSANTPKVNFQQQKPVSPAKPVDIVPLQAPTMAEINMDGGESTTSSNTSSLNMEDTVTDQQLGSKNMNKLNSPIKKNVSISHEEPEEASKVYEEDDLMSVASESIDSLYGDYTLVGADQTSSRPGSAASGNVAMVRPQPKNLVSGHNGVGSPRETRRRGMTQTQLELAKGLEEEDRELMRFYQPQVEANTQELCRLVDEFFTIVEEHQAAKSFVQKIQMICIKTQTLVGFQEIARLLAKEANSLDGLLNECVGSARIAKDKSQSVAAVQQMVTSVMAVSQAALNLKSFWKSCV
uniref:Uncharacterized protein n=1 Tax=Ditylenchus dipsaci TaxID=166011 RepID=A0A915DY68_9BILA